jgi:Bacterial Ig-like domain
MKSKVQFFFLVVALTGVVTAQQPAGARRAVNLALLTAYPSFYHQRPITVVGDLSRTPAGELRVTDETRSVRVVFTGSTPDGSAQVLGEFWDLGRMNPDDPRLGTIDLKKVFEIDPDAGWPRPGLVTAIMATAIEAAPPVLNESIRSLVLHPSRRMNADVTVTGQFAGRNLLGDLPDAPARSQYDFVLRSGDAAIWVVNLRPRGRDFELSLDTRIDTGRWVEVSGKLQQARGLLVLDATGSRLALRQPPTEIPIPPQITASVAPPPEVLFSLPRQNESDVSWSTTVKIQFSRELDQSTLKDRVRVRYLDEEARALGEPDTPVARFTYQYTPANNVLEIKFTEILERYRTIKVDLLEGIRATDKQPLEPWTLTFVTGSH